MDTTDTVEVVKTEDLDFCASCGEEPAEELHSCPLLEELYDDAGSMCNCCSECTIACKDGI